MVLWPSFFGDLGIEEVKKEHEEFLLTYEKNVLSRVYKEINVVEDRLDCAQFVRLALIKLYKNRTKYEDISCVVKSTIKRRVIDFRNKLLKNNSRLITENRLPDNDSSSIEENMSLVYDPTKAIEEVQYLVTLVMNYDFSGDEKMLMQTFIEIYEEPDDGFEGAFFSDEHIRWRHGWNGWVWIEGVPDHWDEEQEKRNKEKFYVLLENFRIKIGALRD